ncbi:MAG: extracellular solute-binding protein [Spirochaetales bacterium]|nr:extracellular solute-binding protein [Spirochaetales bacterium]
MKRNWWIAAALIVGMATMAGANGQDESAKGTDRMQISIAFWDIGSRISSDQKDDFVLFLEDKFDIDIVERNLSWGDYSEKIRLWGASGDLPDVFASDMMLTQDYFQWVEEGLLRALPENLDDYPNVKAVTEMDSVKGLSIDGQFYLLPRTNAKDATYNSAERGIVSRKDWREALGMERPETFEEYMALAKAFTEMDPDGNGVDDTYGMTFVNKRFTSVALLSSVPEAASKSWCYENGRWIPGYASEDMIDGIMELNELWNAGVMDPDTLSLNGNQGMERFCQGNMGMFFVHAQPSRVYEMSRMWNKYNDNDVTDVVEFLPVWTNDEGNRYAFHEGKNFWSSSYFPGTVSDEKMAKIMELYDFFLSEEGQNCFKYGIPGVDWNVEGEDIVRVDDSDMMKKYPSIDSLFNLASWGIAYTNWVKDDFSLGLYTEKIMDMCYDQYLMSTEILSPVNMGIQYLTTPNKAKFERGDMIFDSVLSAMVSPDPAAEWAKTMEQLRAEGLEEAIEEVNAKAKEMGL